jgi:hypothetical protein
MLDFLDLGCREGLGILIALAIPVISFVAYHKLPEKSAASVAVLIVTMGVGMIVFWQMFACWVSRFISPGSFIGWAIWFILGLILPGVLYRLPAYLTSSLRGDFLSSDEEIECSECGEKFHTSYGLERHRQLWHSD